MNNNFTQVTFAVFASVVSVFTANVSSAQVIATPTSVESISQYSFNVSPVLVSGLPNQIGSVYRFAGVSNGVDAIVTIASAEGGATVDIFDDNAISKPEGFSPRINVPANSTGLVEFNIAFVTPLLGTATAQDTLYATAIDIDGGSNLKEIDQIDMGGGFSSYQVGTPEISVTQIGTAFRGVNVAGNEYTSIDTAAKQVMFTVTNWNVTSFSYKCGARNTSNGSVSRQKSIYFKNFTYPVTSSPLAVKYSSFDAVANENKVTLNWVTAVEVNHNKFEVERSFDNQRFETIGVVLGGIQAANGKRYTFKDNDASLAARKVVYYRLKDIDNDGRGNYSKVLMVRLQNDEQVSMQVMPNPFVENLTIRYMATENGMADIRIVAANGQTWLSKHSTISKGNNSIQVQGLANLKPGFYVAHLYVNGKAVASQKVIKN